MKLPKSKIAKRLIGSILAIPFCIGLLCLITEIYTWWGIILQLYCFLLAVLGWVYIIKKVTGSG